MSTVVRAVTRGQRECEPLTKLHFWVFYPILLLISVQNCQGTLTEKDILVKNAGVNVPFGRRVFVSPQNDLK